jgi:fatty-acid desaturase
MNLVTNFVRHHYLIVIHHGFFIYAFSGHPVLCLAVGLFISVLVGHKIGHLHFAHKSYKDTLLNKFFSIIYVTFLGQGSPMQLAYVHRLHHRFSDDGTDPHSPRWIGKWNVYFLNWKRSPIRAGLVEDFRGDVFQKFLNKYYRAFHFIFMGLIFLMGSAEAVGLFLSSVVVVNFHYMGITNSFSHNHNGAINNYKIKYIMPWGYKHKEHHEIYD